MATNKKSHSRKITKPAPTAATTELGNEKFQGVVVKMQKLMNHCEVDWAERQYELGREVRKVEQDLASYGLKKNVNAVKLLAEKTGYKKDTLYNAANVADAWSPPEFARELEKKTEKGNLLTFAIFAEVAKLKSPKAREKMLADARAGNMSSREVRAAVRGDRPKREAAQKPKGDPLAHVFASTQMALDVAHKLAATIKELGDEKGTDAAKLARAAEFHDELAAICASNAKALRELEAAASTQAILSASNLQPKVLMLEAGGPAGQESGSSESSVAATPPAAAVGDEEDAPEGEEKTDGPEKEDGGEDEEESDSDDVADLVEEMSGRHKYPQQREEEVGEGPRSVRAALDFGSVNGVGDDL